MKSSAVLLCLSCCLLFEQSKAAAADTPPNVVLIISDDQAWTDYGFMGHDTIQTPHLDRLASRSALFRRGYVPTALCRPSLATLITGQYASVHGVTGNDPATPKDKKAMHELRGKLIGKIDNYATLPTLLGLRGYASHQSGKWWEGSFQRAGFTHGMTRGFPEPGGRHGDDGLRIGREGMEPVLNFINESVQRSQPFFVWYAPFLPHTPHNPPARLLKKYSIPGRPKRLAGYYAMCEWFDETCGQLVDHLKKRKVSDNTLIVYVTDNGWIQRTPTTEVPDGWKPQFAPRSKQSANEGGIRTPIMLCWPGRIAPSDRDDVVSSIDLFPTILSAAGVDAISEHPGINLMPALTQQKAIDRDAIFGESFAHDIIDLENPQDTLLYRWMIRGRWKLLLTYDGIVSRYKAVHQHVPKEPQLFDVLADPHEENNLAVNDPQRVAQMATRIAEWYPVDQRGVQTVP